MLLLREKASHLLYFYGPDWRKLFVGLEGCAHRFLPDRVIDRQEMNLFQAPFEVSYLVLSYDLVQLSAPDHEQGCRLSQMP
jgi:hypothetical protein